MPEDIIMRLFVEQRRRLVASIMGAAEQGPWWKSLPQAEQVAFRDKVLDSIGIFYDLVRDVIKVGHDDSIRNDHAIALIEQVHAGQRELLRALAPVAKKS